MSLWFNYVDNDHTRWVLPLWWLGCLLHHDHHHHHHHLDDHHHHLDDDDHHHSHHNYHPRWLLPLWWPGCTRRMVNVGRNHFQGCHHHFIHSFVVIITITTGDSPVSCRWSAGPLTSSAGLKGRRCKKEKFPGGDSHLLRRHFDCSRKINWENFSTVAGFLSTLSTRRQLWPTTSRCLFLKSQSTSPRQCRRY